MCHRVTATIVIVIALVLAVTISIGHQHGAHLQRFVMSIIRFFDIMIPVLAVGALIKYLMGDSCCQNKQNSCDHNHH